MPARPHQMSRIRRRTGIIRLGGEDRTSASRLGWRIRLEPDRRPPCPIVMGAVGSATQIVRLSGPYESFRILTSEPPALIHAPALSQRTALEKQHSVSRSSILTHHNPKAKRIPYAGLQPTASDFQLDSATRKGECTHEWNWHRGKSATLDSAADRQDRGKLRTLIDQATGDSVDESDEHAGLLSMIREEVVCPFRRGSPAKTSNASDSSGPRTATA